MRSRLQISVLLTLLCCRALAQNHYPLEIHVVDRDSKTFIAQTDLQTSFASKNLCADYINRLPGMLQSKGFVTVSIDSVRLDSTSAFLKLFAGEQYRWTLLDTRKVDPTLLDAVNWPQKVFENRAVDFPQLQQWENRLLDYLENTGYPFAKVELSDISINGDRIAASLQVDKGHVYTIDSIRIYGNAKISNYYLQRYLDLPRGAIYSRDKLVRINRKMLELPYVEQEKPFDLSMLATGSVLNMYLKPKRSSQVNVLLGFLPNNDQLSNRKLLLTGEANILLRNAFGAGETVGLHWQQVQVKSPQLNVYFQYPYILKSPFSADFAFDILRKDSSYVNINLQFGVGYELSASQSGKVFFQRFQTLLSSGGINEPQIIQTRRLPDIGDVSSLNIGIDYAYNNTDYRLNPRKGSVVNFIISIGNKRVKKNNEIAALKDPSDPNFNFEKLYDTVKLKTYQLRSTLTAARYFPLGKRSTVKTAFNGGFFSSGNIFRNELFQIGGYKLLRGFDEESQYLSHYATGTAEYHYLVGQNSFFYVLVDGGWGRNNSPTVRANFTYVSTGVGLAFETKAGIFNIAWAVGKRNDTEFNLRQSKIHFGFANYF